MRTRLCGLLTAAVLLCLATAAPAGAQTSGGASASGGSTSTSSTRTTGVSTTRTLRLSSSQTRSVQRRVRVRPDGSLGPRTRSALRRYQGRKRLSRTGRPNLQTLRAMKLKFGERLAAEQQQRRATTTQPSAPAEPAAQPASAPAGSAGAAVQAAREAIGTPYGSGGNGPSSYDCSGLTVHAFGRAGISLPRTSFDQYRQGTALAREQVQAGDLVFFDTAGSGASHVGVATSATTAISATTRGVMEHRTDDAYWGAHFVGARRVAG